MRGLKSLLLGKAENPSWVDMTMAGQAQSSQETEFTVDKAIVHPEIDKAPVRMQVLAVTTPASCLCLGNLILVVWENQVPASQRVSPLICSEIH